MYSQRLKARIQHIQTVKWSGTKYDGQNFLTPVLAMATASMGVTSIVDYEQYISGTVLVLSCLALKSQHSVCCLPS